MQQSLENMFPCMFWAQHWTKKIVWTWPEKSRQTNSFLNFRVLQWEMKINQLFFQPSRAWHAAGAVPEPMGKRHIQEAGWRIRGSRRPHPSRVLSAAPWEWGRGGTRGSGSLATNKMCKSAHEFSRCAMAQLHSQASPALRAHRLPLE